MSVGGVSVGVLVGVMSAWCRCYVGRVSFCSLLSASHIVCVRWTVGVSWLVLVGVVVLVGASVLVGMPSCRRLDVSTSRRVGLVSVRHAAWCVVAWCVCVRAGVRMVSCRLIGANVSAD